MLSNINNDVPAIRKIISQQLKLAEKANSSEEKVESKEEVRRPEEKLESKGEVQQKKPEKSEKSVSATLTGEMKEIYETMVQVFSEGNGAEYVEFIKAHMSEGKQRILQLWSDRLSVYQP